MSGSSGSPVSFNDVLVLRRADELLVSEAAWTRRCVRRCLDEATELSLFCALRRASVEVWGEYRHRSAGLEAVRVEIDLRVLSGERFEHRLRDFNNSRSFAEVKDVLRDALARVEVALKC